MIHPDTNDKLEKAVRKLSDRFPRLAWNFLPVISGDTAELISQWLGEPEEDIMVVCFKGRRYLEKFHKQDFFFINFVCQNGYDVLSSKYDNHLHLKEGDCYIGQPYSGYALKIDSRQEVIMIGLHIRKDLFYRDYLSPLSADASLFHFFLDPHTDRFSDEYIRLHFEPDEPVWALLYQMLMEYAEPSEDTQAALRSMMQTMTILLSRKYRETAALAPDRTPLHLQMVSYIGAHSDHVTLQSLADHFGYHPNYVSRLLHEKTGKTFSAHLLAKRMEKAELLLSSTDLSIEKISAMLGYSSPSNFYQSFREYFHSSPREWMASRPGKEKGS